MQRAGKDLPSHDSREDQSDARSDGTASQQLARGFAERDRERRWAAIGRTYTEDVTFIDPDGEFVGWQALSDRAQEPFDGASAGDVFEEDGPTYAGTDTAALAWRFGPPGKPVAPGVDVLTIRDGRVSAVRTLIAPESDA